MNKHFSFLTFVATILLLAGVHRSQAQLVVQNGNFQNLSGLTQASPEWYNGVPTGWTGVNASFTVRELDPLPTGNYVANLNALTTVSPAFVPLYQAVGTLSTAGIVTLNFELIPLIAPTGMSAGIFNTQNSASYNDWTALALPAAAYETAGFQTLATTVAIDAGTPIGIAFWQGSGAPGAPGIDNVSVVPEPSTYALLGLGAAGLGAHLVRRRRR
jgi:hypothetical protein